MIKHIGERYNLLTVIDIEGDKIGNAVVTALCDCGNTKKIQFKSLRQKKNPTRSCGCLRAKNLLKPKEVGSKCGKLTTVKDLGLKAQANGKNRRYVLCHCDCGNKSFETRWDAVENGDTKSCGCLQAESVREARTTHGLSSTKEYRIWTGMKQRCGNPKEPSYSSYGGRGLTVCERWENSFENFFEDMGECPVGMSLDRIDNDKGYFPENCRWTDASTQLHNQRKRTGEGVTSIYRGVYFRKEKNSWGSRFQINNILTLNKTVHSEREAADLYDEEFYKYYGERPNKIIRNSK